MKFKNLQWDLIIWQSSNPDIAVVDEQDIIIGEERGIVTAKSSGRATIRATSVDGSIIAETSIIVAPEGTMNGIKIGEYIEFGKYYGKPISWRVININEDGSPMLLSDRILTLKAFDAKGENTVGRDDPWNSRKQYGGNLWQTSTLRQWLNSSDIKVDYKYNLPTKENVIYNAYDQEKGFLADGNFTEGERNLILNSKVKVLLPEVDAIEDVLEGGEENHKFSTLAPFIWGFEDFKEGFNTVGNYDNAYYTTVQDKVFLLSVKEVNDYIWRNMKFDFKYGKAGPTNEAVYNNEYGQFGLSPEYYWHNWLRTPITFDTYNIRTTDNYEQGLYQKIALDGRVGVRPVINLSAQAMIREGNGTEENPYSLDVQEDTVNVTDIELDRKEAVLFKGNSIKLSARVSPANASNKNIIWISEDSSIASVDQEGLVYANSLGEVKIIATTEDGDYRDYTKIIVKESKNIKANVYVNNDNKNIVVEKIVSNGESYVAIGSGEILYSEDAKHWENMLLPKVERVADIVWDGEKYVILGDNFTIFTSVNGSDWNKVHNLNYLMGQEPGVRVISHKLLHARGRYLVPISNKLFMSSDLINWEKVYEVDISRGIEYKGEIINCGFSIIDIYYDGEIISIAIDFRQSNYPYHSISAIISSNDTSNWNTWFSDEGFTSFYLKKINRITKDKDKFIAYGNMDKVYISYDGIVWEPKILSFDLKNTSIFISSEDIVISDILYSNGRYYGVMDGFLLFSDNGFHWELDSQAINGKELYFGGVYLTDEGRILLYSNYDSRGNLLVDYLGNFYYKENEKSDYIPIRKGKAEGENFIAYGNGVYLIVNRFGDIFTSNDGLKWNQQSPIKGISIDQFDKVVFYSGKFMILENGSLRYRYSTDGIEWKEAYLPEIEVDEKYKTYPIINPPETPHGFILTEKELIVYMAYYPYLWRTTDGINWITELIRDEAAKPYSYIKYSDGLYIGGNHNNRVVVSKDLKQWIPVYDFPIINSAYDIIGFAGGNNKYISIFSLSTQDRRFVGKYAISNNEVDWDLKGLDLEKLYEIYLDRDEFNILEKTIMFEDIKWDGEKFIGIVRYRVSSSSLSPWVRDILTSTDGDTWESYYVDIRDNRNLNPPQIDDNAQSVLIDDGFIFVDNSNVIVKVTFEEKETINVLKVELETKFLTFKTGENKALRFGIHPWNATNKNVIWKSSNEDVALVDNEGIVFGVGAGESIITITTEDGNFSDSCIVTILLDEDVNMFKENLKELINSTEYLKEEDYTKESWSVFQETLKYAIEVKNNFRSTKTELIDARMKLLEAWEKLEIVEFPEDPEVPDIDVEDWHIELFKNPLEEIVIEFSHPVDMELAKEYIFISRNKDGRDKIEGVYLEIDKNLNMIKVSPPNYGYEPGVYYLFIDKELSPVDDPTQKLKNTIRMKFTV